jgi:hypothetical protein
MADPKLTPAELLIQNQRLKNLLAVALRDLTGTRAGRLTPEQLSIFLADCEALIGDWRKT